MKKYLQCPQASAILLFGLVIAMCLAPEGSVIRENLPASDRVRVHRATIGVWASGEWDFEPICSFGRDLTPSISVFAVASNLNPGSWLCGSRTIDTRLMCVSTVGPADTRKCAQAYVEALGFSNPNCRFRKILREKGEGVFPATIAAGIVADVSLVGIAGLLINSLTWIPQVPEIWRSFRGRRRFGPDHCRNCGYPSTGLPVGAVCPECGHRETGGAGTSHRVR